MDNRAIRAMEILEARRGATGLTWGRTAVGFYVIHGRNRNLTKAFVHLFDAIIAAYGSDEERAEAEQRWLEECAERRGTEKDESDA